MSQTSTRDPVRYLAEVEGLEVSLIATAEFGYWEERLRRENLRPYSADGRAEFLVSSISTSFLGVKFRELVFAVTVSESPGSDARDGYYFPAAFHSSPLLAWIERTAFRTPYRPANLQSTYEPQAGVRLSDRDGVLLEAVRTSSEVPTRVEEPWEGPIYLPTPRGRTAPLVLFGRFRGAVEVSPFAADDTFRITGTERHPILRDLVDSNLTPREWRVRPQAIHARSKTYSRGRRS